MYCMTFWVFPNLLRSNESCCWSLILLCEHGICFNFMCNIERTLTCDIWQINLKLFTSPKACIDLSSSHMGSSGITPCLRVQIPFFLNPNSYAIVLFFTLCFSNFLKQKQTNKISSASWWVFLSCWEKDIQHLDNCYTELWICVGSHRYWLQKRHHPVSMFLVAEAMRWWYYCWHTSNRAATIIIKIKNCF